MTKMGFLQRVHGLALCNKVRRLELRKALNIVELLFRIERSQLYQNAHERVARQVLLATPIGKRPTSLATGALHLT